MSKSGLLGVVYLLVVMIATVVAPAAHAVSDDAIVAKRPPKHLSEFGFFDDMKTHRPVAAVIPFRLNTPLFSDHARKMRFVYVPDGSQAVYDQNEAFEFPAGSALIKTFAFPGGTSGPDAKLRLIETRLLLKSERGWQAWAYVWNDEQTDAVLKITGARVEIESTRPDGSFLDFTYRVPNKNQCKGCHSLAGEVVPIGPKARNLNGDYPYPSGARNQLSAWVDAGILARAPRPDSAPRAPDWKDETANLNDRARIWLDINCAHCHRRQGPASNSGLFLTYGEEDPVALGIGKRPVAAGRGSGGRLFDIAPGDPDGSILLFRVESTEAGIMMPELGRTQPDQEAVDLLRRWVSGLR